MKKLVLSLIIFSLTFGMYSQIEQLSEVIIAPLNYRYLNAVNTEDTDSAVKLLEEKVAMYDLKGSELYDDEYETYTVSFYIPEGIILAAYDKDGKVIRTIEKFQNVKLPIAVQNSINRRFPNWKLEKDIYFVTYHLDNDDASKVRKQYKMTLRNDDEVIRIKANEDGDFL
ncbi:nicotinate-nucleotide adenylyltransferase [Tamlana flava]|uniref:nicotinate-nucleotide adenylyltransferase n=1 Tax=Tamlana flava TaxID=3158572 RepID=UPI00351B006C